MKTQTQELLIKAKSLIDTPEKWCQHRLYKGDKCCAVGALRVACFSRDEKPRDAVGYADCIFALASAIESKEDHDIVACITTFNDSHTHAEVMAAFDVAIKEAAK